MLTDDERDGAELDVEDVAIVVCNGTGKYGDEILGLLEKNRVVVLLIIE